ncbi:MAG: IS66 family insertion sequence element accessory protein TnpB [Planctomycetales bacterium]|nr:IS66 family insertion sequence element accessory protein TnpB [Planctomycetales bacterium]
MLSLPPSVKIWLATEPVDMRKGFDGLTSIARDEWKRDPYSGHLFAFVGRRRDRIKILFWDRGGFVLYYKRLEKGRFQIPAVRDGQHTVNLEGTQLSMLLSGFDLNVERLRRWKPVQSVIDTESDL